MPRANLAGQNFGRLQVISYSSSRNKNAYWNCLCACGAPRIFSASDLRKGRTTSCGCYHKEIMAGVNLKHGCARDERTTVEYRTWTDMIHRCHAPGNKAAQYYHDRGIKVCDRWRNSFEAFLADMGPRPSPELSIDRIDNDGNYEPGNCRWATRAVQSQNRRATHRAKAP